jgi:nitrite reductase/ring-hydroxylating ferredoxin subunit
MGTSSQPSTTCKAGDTRQGFVTEVEITEVAVFNIAGEFLAIEDVSTHESGTLAGGDVEGYEIECARHGASCYLSTGKVTVSPTMRISPRS